MVLSPWSVSGTVAAEAAASMWGPEENGTPVATQSFGQVCSMPSAIFTAAV